MKRKTKLRSKMSLSQAVAWTQCNWASENMNWKKYLQAKKIVSDYIFSGIPKKANINKLFMSVLEKKQGMTK